MFGAVWARTVNDPIHRKERSERQERGVSFPPVGVERRLASVLLLLEQRRHLRRDARDQVSSGLARAWGAGERGRRGC